MRGIHANKHTHDTTGTFLDNGLSLAASLLPLQDDVVEKFVRNVLTEEFAQSNRPLIANSTKQFNAIDHQLPIIIQAQVNSSLNEQCDAIVESLLARSLIEAVRYIL